MIIINGARWNVVLVPPSSSMLLTPNNKQAFGCCDNFSHTIYINKELPRRKIKEVICHEITHAVIYSNDILLTSREEEAVVEVITKYGRKINRLTNKAYREIKNRGDI